MRARRISANAVADERRIARVGDQRRQPGGDAERALDGRKQHHATIGGHASTVECGGDFLALNGWQREQQQDIFGHGGCGSVRSGRAWRRLTYGERAGLVLAEAAGARRQLNS